MRKQLKKALSMVLSAAMVVTLGSGISFNQASAADTEYEMSLVGNYGSNWKQLESDKQIFKGDGDYEFKLTATETCEIDNLYVNATGLREAMGENYQNVELSNMKLTVDGEVVPFKGGENGEPTLNEDENNPGAFQIAINQAKWGGSIVAYDAAECPVSSELTFSFTIKGTGLNGSGTTVPSGSAVVFDDAVDWTYGGDEDCRLQIGNTWGNWPFDEDLVEKEFNWIDITFTASGVAEALAAAEIEEIVGELNYNSSSESVNNWTDGDAKRDVVITKDGTYTLSKQLSESEFVKIANYMAIRFPSLDNTVTQSEEKGGQTSGPLKFSDVKVTLYQVPLTTPIEPTEPPEETDPPTEKTPYIDKELWADKTGVHAYVTYQTAAWDCRNQYNDTIKLGEEYSAWYIKASGAEVEEDAVVEDVLLTGDGDYTVSISGIDLSNADSFNWLGVGSDILNASYPDVQITNATIKIDGEEINSEPVNLIKDASEDEAYFNYATFMALKAGDNTGTVYENCPFVPDDVVMPEDSIEITFTVSGMDKIMKDIESGSYIDPTTGEPIGGGTKPTEQPSASPSTQPSTQPSAKPSPSTQPTKAPETVVGVAQGKSFTSGNFSYKVTKAATTSKQGTVTVSLTKKGKKAAKLTVGATVKKSGATYTINAVAKNAFKGAKAKQVTLGKNIKKIPAGAFANCKKLTKLTLKAKLSSVAKKSFKGCKKKITVKGTGKKANVKKLKKSGYKKFK